MRQLISKNLTVLIIYQKFVSTGSVAKQDRPGRARKFDERGGESVGLLTGFRVILVVLSESMLVMRLG